MSAGTRILSLLVLGLALGVASADDQASNDRKLDKALRDAINHGAKLYNQGDPKACVAVFEGALVTARPLLSDQRQLQRSIDDALEDGQQQQCGKSAQRAFALRRVLDNIRSELADQEDRQKRERRPHMKRDGKEDRHPGEKRPHMKRDGKEDRQPRPPMKRADEEDSAGAQARDLEGRWEITYPNKQSRTLVIERGGKVSSERGKEEGRLERRQNRLVIVGDGDDKVESLTQGSDGRLFVEEFTPRNAFPDRKPNAIGVGVRRR